MGTRNTTNMTGIADTQMNVLKRNGTLEPVNLQKILKAVSRAAKGIEGVDPTRVATQTIGGLYNGATTRELDELSIQTAISLASANENYNKLAAIMRAEVIRKEVVRQSIHSFSQSITVGYEAGLITEPLYKFVTANARKLDNAINDDNNQHFEYFALLNVEASHLLHLEGKLIETPQFLFMRVAAATSKTAKAAIEKYKSLATQEDTIADADFFTTGLKTAAAPLTQSDEFVPYRPLKGGMGQAVAERTILRKKADGAWENWGDVANRVALGNALLVSTPNYPSEQEYKLLRKHLANANTLLSGRHLQHGDADQPKRNMEVYTNCSTSSTSFLLFYLLLNGSGVGRSYDDDMILVNWDHAPSVRCVLDTAHADFQWGVHESLRDAKHKYGQGENVIWHDVADNREGWAKALEIWEMLAFEKIHAHKMLILNFTPVRKKGSPIGGMQSRPASGPAPLMSAFTNAASLKGAGLALWKQAIYVDHYFAECVLVGGARRAARMSTKHWSDRTVLDFVTVKRPLEYVGLSAEEITAKRTATKYAPMAFLWSSNNSVTVDEHFWALLQGESMTEEAQHARAVFQAVCAASYGDGTGEPGFINSHRLVQKDEGWTDLNRGDFVGSAKYQLNDDTQILMSRLSKAARRKTYHTITNPCGEIALNVLGGFCVIADVVPFHAATLDEAEECIRVVTRALIRVNTMDSIYNKEVKRTNRIGVGLTGVHEFAWKFFQVGFRELIADFDLLMNEFGFIETTGDATAMFEAIAAKAKSPNAVAFWLTLARFNRAVNEEAITYSGELGVAVPHTQTTIKPAGTTSKLYGLTEGWHLPAMAYYLRWVQFRNDDPLVEQYRNSGYPVRELKEYSGTTIVGFPTAPTITELGMGDALLTAGEATPEEQFKWLLLGEKFWINGTDEYGKPVEATYGNQISYTLKYKPEIVDYQEFASMILKYQSQVRCCSVMPQEDGSSYEYLPEQPISREDYDRIVDGLAQSVFKKSEVKEEIGREHVGCDSGACPVDFNSGKK